ncbi:hypothetical protein IFR05_000868 [Cadophora sp. M221]|nr:hypothetical protein IFR05_000868 [Cadophora sp. M221]
MAFGILEPADPLPHPLGTTLIEELHGSKGNKSSHEVAQVILIPSPSSSPYDPLNWSRVKKELVFLTILLGAAGTAVAGPCTVPAFGILAATFNTSLTNIALLNGSLIMGLGVSSYLCAALATVYGKRLIYVSTQLLLVVSTCWAAGSSSYASLATARAFQGLGMGCFYALAGTASINDIFFVHERGRRVGLWNFSILVVGNITPIISSRVTVGLSWEWMFGIIGIYFAVVLVLVLLLFPETSFDRGSDSLMPVLLGKQHKTPVLEDGFLAECGTVGEKRQSTGNKAEILPISEPAIVTPNKWNRILGFGTFQIKDQSRVFRHLVSPIALLRHPVAVWSCLMWTVTFSLIIIQGSTATQIFGAPPYNLDPATVGNLVGIAPLIGAALGTLFGGYMCDFLVEFMAKKNNGIYEPEYRLLVLGFYLVTVIPGTFGLGMAIESEQSAIVCAVFLGIMNFAIGVGCTGIVSYSNDTLQHRAGENFGLTMIIKSAYAFGLSFVFNDFYALHGPRIFWFTWGALAGKSYETPSGTAQNYKTLDSVSRSSSDPQARTAWNNTYFHHDLIISREQCKDILARDADLPDSTGIRKLAYECSSVGCVLH